MHNNNWNNNNNYTVIIIINNNNIIIEIITSSSSSLLSFRTTNVGRCYFTSIILFRSIYEFKYTYIHAPVFIHFVRIYFFSDGIFDSR